ncbi:MAG: type II toxin-antitoxin system RelE/ParE family toxin [Kiritimatiellia bacterium]
MAYRLNWSPSARYDLRAIFAYIAEDDSVAAGKFTRGVIEAVERLPDFPQSGRIVPEIGDPLVRELIRQPCRIVYRINSEQESIEIARVWHAARGKVDIQTALDRLRDQTDPAVSSHALRKSLGL